MTPGNLVHRRSSIPIFGAIIGHAGIVVGADRIIDCNTERGRVSVREVSFDDFVSGEEFWGERELPEATSGQKSGIVARARQIASWATEYDDAHNNQKGRVFNQGQPDEYWEADCVGLCEHCYEHVGLDIVSNEGIFLTVPEQRDAMRRVLALSPDGRSQLFASFLEGNLSQRERWIFYQEFPSDLLKHVYDEAKNRDGSLNRRLTDSACNVNLLSESEAGEVLLRVIH
jgi:hypothetical protein